jgi:hypothetical protein
LKAPSGIEGWCFRRPRRLRASRPILGPVRAAGLHRSWQHWRAPSCGAVDAARGCPTRP